MKPLTQQEVLEKINKSESFEGVEIGDVNFSRFTFDKPVNFTGAKFTGNANFNEVTFKGKANFCKTTFMSNVNYYGAMFMEDTNFKETNFKDNADFYKSTFIDKTDFYRATFNGKVDFYKATFKDKVDFYGVTFNLFSFISTTLMGDANFYGTSFGADAKFNEVTFKKTVDFNRATFKESSFTNATFTGDANFDGVIFKDDVDFYEAKFTGNTNFSGAEFTGNVDFFEAKFTAGAYFYEAKFTCNANFSGAEFTGNADFSGAKFSKEAVFKGAKSNFIFTSGINFVNDLRNITFEDPEKIKFDTISFQRCLLENNISNLSKIALYNIEWPVKEKKSIIKKFGKNRKVIFDEIYSDKDKKYSNIKKVYSDLVINCEEKRNFDLAEDFHFGEMEMRRLSYNKFFQTFSLLSFYKYLSGYGQNTWRAVFWLLFFILIPPFIYLFTGLNLNKSDAEINNNVQIIEYRLSDDFSTIVSKNYWTDYLISALYGLELCTLRRDKMGESINEWGRFFEVLQSILVYIQVALCITTLRRSFRR